MFGFELKALDRLINDIFQADFRRGRVDSEFLAVNVFRLGRLSLFFQTPDNQRCGWYNPSEKRWQLLPDEYNQAVTAAIDIAEKRRSVRILNLPLGRIAIP